MAYAIKLYPSGNRNSASYIMRCFAMSSMTYKNLKMFFLRLQQ